MFHVKFSESFRSRSNVPAILLVAVLALVCIAQAVAPPLCTAQGSCPDPPEPARYGLQPYPGELVDSFDRAGTNRLGNEGPDLPQIWKGYPPSQAELISPYAPCILLKAIGYTESAGWKQFEADYGQEGWTVISPDCGYGIMQITSGMEGGAGFEPYRVAGEPAYNIGTGARILIQKWNALAHYIGNHSPHVVEDWYYAVWAYNGGLLEDGTLTWYGNPNNPRYRWPREAWLCGQDMNQERKDWPYQELIWGCAANPPAGTYFFWDAVPLTLPDRADLNSDPPPPHIDTPSPSHSSCSVVGLPDIRMDANDWNSTVVLRNNGVTTRGTLKLYDQYGVVHWTLSFADLQPNQIWEAPLPSASDFNGSAMVEAHQDVAVVVQNRHPDMITAYDGISAITGITPDPGFACAAETLHLPLIIRDYENLYLNGDTWNTTIHIQNAGTATAEVSVEFFNQDGSSKYTGGPYTIQPGASVKLDQFNCWQLGTSFMGSATVTSDDQPVAAIVNEVNMSNNRAMAYNAFSSGALNVYLPFSSWNWHSLYSDIPVKNIGADSSTVEVTYYEQGTGQEWYDWRDVGSNELEIFYPPPDNYPYGMNERLAAAVVTNNSRDLIALVHERRDQQDYRAQYMTYNGVAKTDSM
ncbi:MAG: hypothetical protein KJ548_15315, partial [Actinobacteria bacterium]|nr:hypothetical protein [Actinomycetota bacterium]